MADDRRTRADRRGEPAGVLLAADAADLSGVRRVLARGGGVVDRQRQRGAVGPRDRLGGLRRQLLRRAERLSAELLFARVVPGRRGTVLPAVPDAVRVGGVAADDDRRAVGDHCGGRGVAVRVGVRVGRTGRLSVRGVRHAVRRVVGRGVGGGGVGRPRGVPPHRRMVGPGMGAGRGGRRVGVVDLCHAVVRR